MSEFDTTIEATSDDYVDNDPTAVAPGADLTADGGIQTAGIDIDGDGSLDGYAMHDPSTGLSVALVDVTNDGVYDLYTVDTNGDGVPDVSVVRDGENFTITSDSDGNGIVDGAMTLSEDEFAAEFPELYELLGGPQGLRAGAPIGEGFGEEFADKTSVGTELYDHNEDGVNDGFITYYDDGTSTMVADFDGDGEIDYIDVDTSGDGYADEVIRINPDGSVTHEVDTDGDEYVDTVAIDADGDGTIDAVFVDTDGDGTYETQTS